MNENNGNEPTSGLQSLSDRPAQFGRPQPAPIAPEQMVTKETIDPLTKARIEYDAKRRQLLAQQQKLVESLEARISGPQDIFMAMAQGFGAPTRGGSFGESLSNALGGVSAVQKERRGIETDLAKMKLDLNLKELEQDKEGMLSSAIMGQIGGQGGQGAPGGQGGMSLSPQARQMLGTLAALDPKSAIKTLIEFQRDEAKRPDAVKALDTYIASLPPDQQEPARQFAARSNIYGKPGEVADARIKIAQAIREGVMTQEQGDAELARMSGGMQPSQAPAAQSGPVTRLSSPNEAEALATAKTLDASNIPFSIDVAQGTSGAAQARPEAPTRPAVNISPKGSEEIEIARAKTRAEGEEKDRLARRTELQDNSEKARRIVNDATAVFDIVNKNPAAFGILAKPGISNALLTLVENGIRVGNFSVGFNDIQSAILRAGGTQSDIDAAAMLAQIAVQTSLDLSAAVKGSVSNYEQTLFQQASYSKNDSPNVLKYKAELARARGEFDRFVWNKYKQFEKQGGRSVEDFKDSEQYHGYVKQYEDTLKKVRSTYIR
jgi:hypothetical protein